MTRVAMARLAASVVAVAGYWLPWVAHRTAGLSIAAVDLPEFPKFMPQVQSGELAVWREAFYMPLLALALGVALWMASERTLPAGARWLLRAFAVGLPLMPSVFNVLESTELQTQLRLAGLVLIGVCLSSPWRRLPVALRAAVLACLFLLGALSPALQFWQVRPALDSIYGTAVQTGAGLWVSLGAFGLLAVLELAEPLFRARRQVARA